MKKLMARVSLNVCGLFVAHTIQAQSINLQQTSVRLLSTDIPVDVGIVQSRPPSQTLPDLVVASQGSNTVSFYLQLSGQRFGRLTSDIAVQQPLSLLPLGLDPVVPSTLVSDFIVLTANGNVSSYLRRGFPHRLDQTFAFRGGLPCASTDRLVAGNFQPGNGIDIACWSNGPQPGFSRAKNNGTGWFIPLPAVPARPGDSATVMTTANLFNDPQQREDALVPLTSDRNGAFVLWPHIHPNTAQTADYSWFDLTSNYATSTGRCRSVVAGDVNGDGTTDVVAGGNLLSVRLVTAQGGYQFMPTVETYAYQATVLDMKLADLTGDNRPELLVLGSNNVLSVFENTSRTGTQLFNPSPYDFLTGSTPALIRTADIDMDGDMDVMIPCKGDNSISIFWNGLRVLTTTSASPNVQLEAYPNPATDMLTLRWRQEVGMAAVTLVDLTGRKVRTWEAIATGEALQVVDLPRGMYVLQWKDKQQTFTRRILLK